MWAALILLLIATLFGGCAKEEEDAPKTKHKKETIQSSDDEKTSGLLTGLFGNSDKEENEKTSGDNQMPTEGYATEGHMTDGRTRYIGANGAYADVEVCDGKFDSAKMYESNGVLMWSLDWGCDYVQEYDDLQFAVGYTPEDGYIYSKIDANYELWIPFEYSENNDPLTYAYVLLTDNTFRVYWISQYRDSEGNYLCGIDTFDFYR